MSSTTEAAEDDGDKQFLTQEEFALLRAAMHLEGARVSAWQETHEVSRDPRLRPGRAVLIPL